jgi:TFIIF-interacting CTD phosphatase-like protein
MSKKNKKNLLLDLDQTLICACDVEEYKVGTDIKMDKKIDKKIFGKIIMKSDEDPKKTAYTICQRPNLDTFLDFIFENFNVSVWTAASKDYALFVINKFILKIDSEDKDKYKKRKLDYIFFSYHCDISKKIKKGTKDLSILWDDFKLSGYSIDNTFIIDDHPEVYKIQTGNCIQIPEFNVLEDFSETDSELITIQKEFQQMIKNSESLQTNIDIINKNLIAKKKKKL